jgi:hypothetical protein
MDKTSSAHISIAFKFYFRILYQAVHQYKRGLCIQYIQQSEHTLLTLTYTYFATQNLRKNLTLVYTHPLTYVSNELWKTTSRPINWRKYESATWNQISVVHLIKVVSHKYTTISVNWEFTNKQSSVLSIWSTNRKSKQDNSYTYLVMFVCMTFTRNTHVFGVITPRRNVEPCARQQCTHGVVHVLTSCVVALNTCTTLIPTKYTFLQTKTITHHHHHKNRIKSHSVPPGHITKIQFCTPLDCMHFLPGLSNRILKIMLHFIQFHVS